MLCGPPATLMKRTVLPGAIVSALGSNLAWVVPLPIILTSTTGPVGAAGVVVAVAAGCFAAGSAAFLPPHATPAHPAGVPNQNQPMVYILVSRIPGPATCGTVSNIYHGRTNRMP